MKNCLKIVVADQGTEFAKSCVRVFKTYGMEVNFCEKDGLSLIDKVQSYKPDIILADVFMPKLDIFGVISELKKINLEKRPLVMAMSAFDNQKLERELLETGISYYFLKPFNLEIMAERIIQFVADSEESAPVFLTTESENDAPLELAVTKILHKVGVPPHIKGFHFLREAIMLSVKNSDITNSITKLLYPAVAAKHLTTPSRVERAIRHAIEVAWDRGDINALNEYFGYTLECERTKPTNSEFIALISDCLRLKLKTE